MHIAREKFLRTCDLNRSTFLPTAKNTYDYIVGLDIQSIFMLQKEGVNKHVEDLADFKN